MRKITKCLFTALFILNTVSMMSQNSITSIIDIGEKKINSIEEAKGSIIHIDFDIIYDDDDEEVIIKLERSKTYHLYAFSTDRVSNLDLELFTKKRGKWVKSKSDKTTANDASIKFRSSKTTEYRIVIKGSKFADDFTSSHYGLIIHNN